MATIEELMEEFGLTEEIIEQRAQEYETEQWELNDTQIHTGSHYDAVGRKRVTVTYPAEEVQKVSIIASAQGLNASDIYRKALTEYLLRIEHNRETAKERVGA